MIKLGETGVEGEEKTVKLTPGGIKERWALDCHECCGNKEEMLGMGLNVGFR